MPKKTKVMAVSKRRLASATGEEGTSAGAGLPASPEAGWNYTTVMKLFHATQTPITGLDPSTFGEWPSERAVPGYLCQAARNLIGLSQQELHLLSRVSKKSINDYENGFAILRPPLIERIASTLREQGARLVTGPGFVGVVASASRDDEQERSRSPRKAPTQGRAPRPPETSGTGVRDKPGLA